MSFSCSLTQLDRSGSGLLQGLSSRFRRSASSRLIVASLSAIALINVEGAFAPPSMAAIRFWSFFRSCSSWRRLSLAPAFGAASAL